MKIVIFSERCCCLFGELNSTNQKKRKEEEERKKRNVWNDKKRDEKKRKGNLIKTKANDFVHNKMTRTLHNQSFVHTYVHSPHPSFLNIDYSQYLTNKIDKKLTLPYWSTQFFLLAFFAHLLIWIKKMKKSTDCTCCKYYFLFSRFLSEAVSWGDRDRKLEKNIVVSTEHVQPYERVR